MVAAYQASSLDQYCIVMKGQVGGDHSVQIIDYVPPFFVASQRAGRARETNVLKMRQQAADKIRIRRGRASHRVSDADHTRVAAASCERNFGSFFHISMPIMDSVVLREDLMAPSDQ